MAKPKNAEKYGVKSRLVLTAEADETVKNFQDDLKKLTGKRITKNDAINRLIASLNKVGFIEAVLSAKKDIENQ